VGGRYLTPKERVALTQIIRGASSKEVARNLGISPRTVDFHRANLPKTLCASNDADLAHKMLGEQSGAQLPGRSEFARKPTNRIGPERTDGS
jgi:DNA-binding CsgD family transcriptional regulator